MKTNPTLDSVSGQVFIVNENKTSKKTLTQAQMAHRIQFVTMASTYTLMSRFIKKTYEKKTATQSDYNLFMRANLGRVKTYLTKNETEAGALVVAPYNISKGTLPPITTAVQADRIITSIRVPQGFSISEETTQGQVSAALINANPDICKRDQISILHVVQNMSDGIPRATVKLHKFILDPQSDVPFYKVMPQHLFIADGGYIGTEAYEQDGGIAYVLSRKSANKKHISTQHIVLAPGNTLYNLYASEEKKTEAVESYGINLIDDYTDPDSIDTRQDDEDTYFAVTKVTKNSIVVPQESGELNVVSGDVIEITGTKLTEVEIKARILTDPTGTPSTVGLSEIGTVQGITDRSVKITANKTLDIFYLLRADNAAIIYNFG